MEYKIRNLSLNYEIKGEGKSVIMLHGYSLDHRIMTECMEPIFKTNSNFKRIYLDLPGMGKSSSADWIVNSDTLLEIVIDFINKIIPNENFLLAGESYGGYLSRGILYKLPTRVDGLLLICPVIIADSKKRTVPEHVVLSKDEYLLSKIAPEDVEDFNSCAVVQSKKIYERYHNEIISGVKLADNIFLDKLQKYGYQFSFDIDKLDKKYLKPVLIMLGKQDSCVGYFDAWRILDNFPRATFAVLDKAGHNLQIEQEDLFNALVNEWLKRVVMG